MKVLVTGSNGFVGRAFTRRLVRDGWEVTALDNMSAGLPRQQWHDVVLPASCRMEKRWDVRGGVTAMDHPDDYDLIIHCAAVVGGRLKIDGDPLALAVDLAIDGALFNWLARAKRHPLVIYFSSSAVYPVELQTREKACKLAESLLQFPCTRVGMPDQVYGLAKFVGESLAQTAIRQYGCRILTYRPFSGYGEDQSFDYPFPSLIRRVLNKEAPITIWGSGDQCRDFIHIDDIVDAVLETKDVLKPGEVLNLGSSVPMNFYSLVRLAEEVLYPGDPVAAIVSDTTKPEGVFYRVADTYKLSQFYKPKVSLEEGIRRVAKHLEQINGKS